MPRFLAIAAVCALVFPAATGMAWAKACADTATLASGPAGGTEQPVDILARFQFGGLGLSSAARDLIMRNTDNAALVIQMIDRASPSQKSSLARGLGEAAGNCQPFAPEAVAQLSQMVAQRGDVDFMREFRMAQAQSGGTPAAPSGPSAPGTPAVADKCYAGAPPAMPEALQAVSSNPAGLLEKFPSGGPALTSEIRNLMVTDASILAALGKIQQQASKEQRTAIAAGLAQAANACQIVAPVVTQNIQRFIVAMADEEIERTFRAVTGDRAVGATFAAFGAAPTPGGGGPISGGAVTTGSQGANAVAQAARAAFSFSSASANTPATSARSVFLSVSP